MENEGWKKRTHQHQSASDYQNGKPKATWHSFWRTADSVPPLVTNGKDFYHVPIQLSSLVCADPRRILESDVHYSTLN